MRRLFSTAVTLALAVSPVLAQDPGHRPLAPGMSSTHGMSDSAAAMLAMLAERLDLSADQRVAAMPRINTLHAAALEAHALMVRWQADSTALDGPSMRRQIAAARRRVETERAAFVELLTDEQRTTFTAMHQHRHQDANERHDSVGPPHDAEHGAGHHDDGGP